MSYLLLIILWWKQWNNHATPGKEQKHHVVLHGEHIAGAVMNHQEKLLYDGSRKGYRQLIRCPSGQEWKCTFFFFFTAIQSASVHCLFFPADAYPCDGCSYQESHSGTTAVPCSRTGCGESGEECEECFLGDRGECSLPFLCPCLYIVKCKCFSLSLLWALWL